MADVGSRARSGSASRLIPAKHSATWSNRVAVYRSSAPSSIPGLCGSVSRGSKSIETSMCGGSANHCFRPSQVNGERTRFIAASPERARAFARGSRPRGVPGTYYQYKADRARRTLRGIDEQVA